MRQIKKTHKVQQKIRQTKNGGTKDQKEKHRLPQPGEQCETVSESTKENRFGLINARFNNTVTKGQKGKFSSVAYISLTRTVANVRVAKSNGLN